MTPNKQLFRHSPAEGLIGDCWRTCIACLLDLRPDEVPHFCADCWEDNQKATANAREFLALANLDFVEVAFQGDLDLILRGVAAANPGKFYLLAGNSKNGVGHSVICCDDRIVWDPSLDDSGIVGPMDDGYYWVTWLVPAWINRKESNRG